MSYSIDLGGRWALVTGASSGLGEHFARVLVRAGARVVLASRRTERLNALAAELGDGAKVVRLDVADLDSIRSAVTEAETHGPIDILINNSGVSVSKKLVDITAEDYDLVMDTNVRGAFFVAQEVARRMIERNKAHPPGTAVPSRIVNIASTSGIKAVDQMGVYGTSKAALIHMTRNMALEWGRYGINVNALCPGFIDTEMSHDLWSTDRGKRIILSLPRRRIGKAEDVDLPLLMLCAGEGHFVNGAIIQADDGVGI